MQANLFLVEAYLSEKDAAAAAGAAREVRAYRDDFNHEVYDSMSNMMGRLGAMDPRFRDAALAGLNFLEECASTVQDKQVVQAAKNRLSDFRR